MGKESKGRVWQITDTAHICQVYNGSQEYIFSDIPNEIKPKPRNSQDDDTFYYNSAISIPLLGENLKPRGVFCLTSSSKFAFTAEDKNDEIKQKIHSIQVDCIFAIANVISTLFLKRYGQDNTEPLQELITGTQSENILTSNI